MAYQLLNCAGMPTTLDLVYLYRVLTGRCSAGAGLNFEEIDTLAIIEGAFMPDDPRGQLTCHPVSLTAILRQSKFHDPVEVVRLGPSRCICRRAPYVDEGAVVELVIDSFDSGHSYRFKAVVTTLDDDDDDFRLGLDFIGVPVQVRYPSHNSEFVDASNGVDAIAA